MRQPTEGRSAAEGAREPRGGLAHDAGKRERVVLRDVASDHAGTVETIVAVVELDDAPADRADCAVVLHDAVFGAFSELARAVADGRRGHARIDHAFSPSDKVKQVLAGL